MGCLHLLVRRGLAGSSSKTRLPSHSPSLFSLRFSSYTELTDITHLQSRCDIELLCLRDIDRGTIFDRGLERGVKNTPYNTLDTAI
jgi:hypothetical protein